ncbi:helix-turn-helix transcriptional regulator [Nitrospira sp. Kam-Ns4a]
MTEEQVANMLQVSRRTLQAWRIRGGGPPFAKIGARMVRYRESDVAEWLATCTRTEAAGCQVS